MRCEAAHGCHPGAGTTRSMAPGHAHASVFHAALPIATQKGDGVFGLAGEITAIYVHGRRLVAKLTFRERFDISDLSCTCIFKNSWCGGRLGLKTREIKVIKHSTIVTMPARATAVDPDGHWHPSSEIG